MQNPVLHERFIEWVSEYCMANDIAFDGVAVRTFRQNLSEENFEQRFSEICDYLNGF